MKVDSNQVNNHLNVSSSKNSKVEGGKADQKDSSAVSAKDLSSSAKVEFSEQAQAINKIKELATPDMDTIREDKVAHFQKMIDEGKYQVDASSLADKLVDEHLMY